MPRRRTKPGDIRNPEHYFNRYIAGEVLKDRERTAEYYEHNDSLEELLAGGSEGSKKGLSMSLANNTNGEDLLRRLSEESLFAWIEQIEDAHLYCAVSGLSEQHKVLLSLRFQFCYSQAETAKVMGIAQQTVSRYETRILKKIKKFLKKGCRKP